jgi:hypothetical protein
VARPDGHVEVAGNAAKNSGYVAAMTLIRITMSIFVLLLISVSLAGWIWTGSHQAPAQAIASRVVLTLGMAGGLVGLFAIWRNPGAK